ncbi:hypothetical protein [Streptomyces sp. NPDC019890]|uniref:hypothetical protein n=1 Tax=Streptomyces sp. NPDC019890 TaxID=3365064 RepID=UPI00384D8E9F
MSVRIRVSVSARRMVRLTKVEEGQELPPRADDPGTDGRRYASGYIGLQVHGTTDVISYRNIRVKEL